MTFAPYTAVRGCGNDGPGAANMLYWLDRESQWRNVGFNLGVCACRGTGAGTTSQHARCRAWDLGLPLVNGRANPIGHDIVRALIPVAGRLGLTELIWDRKRYSAAFPGGKRYTGVSPHYDHIHGAHTLNATRLLNVPTIRHVMGTAPRPPAPPSVVRPPTEPPPPPPPPVPEPPLSTEYDMAGTLTVNIPAHFLNNMTWEFSYGDKGKMYRKYVPRAGDRAKVMIAALAAWGSDPIAVDGPLNNNPKVNMLNVLMERSVDVTPSGDYRVDGYGQLADRQAAAGFR